MKYSPLSAVVSSPLSVITPLLGGQAENINLFSKPRKREPYVVCNHAFMYKFFALESTFCTMVFDIMTAL